MQIIGIEPVHEVNRDGRTRCVATVDVEYDQDLRLYGMRLLRLPDGGWRLYAPQKFGGARVASFSPAVARELTEMAVAAWEAAR